MRTYPHSENSPTCICQACTTNRHGKQNDINLAASMPTPSNAIPEELRQNIIEHADASHSELPQYEGAWDDWSLVEVTGKIRTKLGLAFEKGDITIGRYQAGAGFGPGSWTLYSIRNGINTAGGMAREIPTFEVRRNEIGTGRSEVWTTHTKHIGADRALDAAPKSRDTFWTIQPILEVCSSACRADHSGGQHDTSTRIA